MTCFEHGDLRFCSTFHLSSKPQTSSRREKQKASILLLARLPLHVLSLGTLIPATASFRHEYTQACHLTI